MCIFTVKKPSQNHTCQISASEVGSKNRSKKKSFFYFCSPTISQQAVLFRKAIRPLPASLSSREKTLCRSVILTGFFDCKYSLFWGGYQIYQSGGPQKIDQKKIFFFTFFLEVSPNLAHVSAWPYDQQGNVWQPFCKKVRNFRLESPLECHLSTFFSQRELCSIMFIFWHF